MFQLNTNIPLQQINDPEIAAFGVHLYIKRDDLNHPLINGNKWYKLKYNLKEAKKQNKKVLLTFGGAFSNHIAATAAAGKEVGFDTIGIIRGEKHIPLNPTLQFASGCGMQLHYLSRELYRKKTALDYIDQLHQQFGDFYLLPEGGSNELAIKGCSEILKTVKIDFDYVCCPSGTAATVTGIITSIKPNQKAIGFSVLKGGEFLNENVKNYKVDLKGKWEINVDYHFGGYAKTTKQLIDFVTNFKKKNDIALDYIYTGKMMFGIYDLIKKGFFKTGETIIAVHTGGLQGNSQIDKTLL